MLKEHKGHIALELASIGIRREHAVEYLKNQNRENLVESIRELAEITNKLLTYVNVNLVR